MHIPSVRIVIPLCMGIAVADAWLLKRSLPIGAYLAMLSVLLGVLLVCHRWSARVSFMCGSAMFVFMFGAMRLQMRHNGIIDGAEHNTHLLKGRVVEAPRAKKKSTEVVVKTQRGDMILAYTKQTKKPEIGDFIEVFTIHGIEPTYQVGGYCFDHSDNPDFPLERYRHNLYRRGIAATCYADSIAVAVPSGNNTIPFITRLHRLQTAMADEYRKAGIDGDEGALIEAMTTGSRLNLSSELRNQYSRAGTSHVLALSGFHLTIIYALLEILLFTRLMHGWLRRGTRIMSIVLIWAFVVIAGAPPSLVRAAIMCTLMTVSQIVSVHVSDDNRHINIRWGNFLDEMGENGLINSLSIAAIIMLVYDPFMLFDIGFQLSFMSMLGLCLCRDIAARIMRVIKLPIPEMLIAAYIVVMLRWVVRAATGVALTSIICTVFTFPLVAYYFGTIPTMSVLTNILISLPAFALLVLAAAWWICAPVAAIQALIGKCLIGTADVMNGVTRWVSAMDNAVIEWHPTLLHVILVYVLIAVVGRMYSRMVRKIDATRTI